VGSTTLIKSGSSYNVNDILPQQETNDNGADVVVGVTVGVIVLVGVLVGVVVGVGVGVGVAHTRLPVLSNKQSSIIL
jgi:hypothetical protein